MAKQTIIVMSDSHGDSLIVEEIRDRYVGKVDFRFFITAILNCVLILPLWEGIRVVKGNMDFYAGYPERLVTELGSTKIIQTHGHLFDINFNFQKLDYWAQEEEADICLYGHLHVPNAWMEGKTLFLNPGSSVNHVDHQRMSLCSCGNWWQLFQSRLFDTRPWGVSGLVQGV